MHSNSEIQPSAPNLQALFHADVVHRAAQRQQNFLLGFLAGFMAMLAGTSLWVVIAAAVHCECSFLAVGVGCLVGAAIQFCGRGVVWLFSGVGAGLAAAGCTLGTLFTACATLARSQGADFWTTLGALRPASALTLLQQRVGPLEIVFFSCAVGLGWVLARRSAAPR